jgi:hypothetical protein
MAGYSAGIDDKKIENTLRNKEGNVPLPIRMFQHSFLSFAEIRVSRYY